MKTRLVCVVALVAMIFGAVSSSQAVIRRVPARYNLLSFYGGYASPHGKYDEIGLIILQDEFTGLQRKFNADRLFDGTFYLGFDYGSIVNRNFQVLVGFRYTNNKVQNYIHQYIIDTAGVDFTYRTYDLSFEANFYPIDLAEHLFSPYVGAGFQAGFVVYKEDGYDSETRLKVAGSVNFGADLKVLTSPSGRSFVSVASVNSYNVFASDNRPQYLFVGGALRYWFR